MKWLKYNKSNAHYRDLRFIEGYLLLKRFETFIYLYTFDKKEVTYKSGKNDVYFWDSLYYEK